MEKGCTYVVCTSPGCTREIVDENLAFTCLSCGDIGLCEYCFWRHEEKHQEEGENDDE